MNRNDSRLKRGLRWLPAVGVMAAIFWFSSRTGNDLEGYMPWFEWLLPGMQSFNWGHFVAYFLLALAFDYGFGSKADRWSIKVIIVLLCGMYGITDEYHQTFVEGRFADAADVRNDMIGAFCAVLLLAIPAVRRQWRKIAS